MKLKYAHNNYKFYKLIQHIQLSVKLQKLYESNFS